MFLRSATPDSFFQAVDAEDFADPFNSESVTQASYHMTEQLADRVTDYDLIVADDTSGRLASIVMHRVVSNARELEGLSKPQLRFMLGSSPKKVPDGFITEPESPSARTMIVTEGMCSGRHVRNIGQFVTKVRQGESIDIASVGTFSSFPSELRPISGAQLFLGTSSSNVGNMLDTFANDSGYKGVSSDRGGTFATRNYYDNFDRVNRSRRDAKLFGDLLFENLFVGFEPPYPLVTEDIEKVLV